MTHVLEASDQKSQISLLQACPNCQLITTDWKLRWTVASLTLVSPGAVYFFLKKWWPFSHPRHSHPLRLPGDFLSAVLCKFSRKKCKLSGE